MQLKLPFNLPKAVTAEASVEINKPIATVFSYIAEQFFQNYPKWAQEVLELHPLDGEKTFVGAKGKQIRENNGTKVESVFAITEYQPNLKFTFQGLDEPYRHCYLLESQTEQLTRLTFQFELLELEIFMRPFEKLIRTAIEDGAENTANTIKNLLMMQAN